MSNGTGDKGRTVRLTSFRVGSGARGRESRMSWVGSTGAGAGALSPGAGAGAGAKCGAGAGAI